MAKYKVWLTVKDRYGNIKELDGGNINVDLAELTDDELDVIEEGLPLEKFVTKTEIDAYATDEEVDTKVKESNEVIRYSKFKD